MLTTIADLTFVLTTAAVCAAICFGIGRLGATPAERRRATAITTGALLAWLALTGALAAAGALSDFAAFPPRVTPVIIAGNLAAIVVAASPLGGRLARATPVAWLVGLQTFRIGVELALALLYHAGVVPLQMTIEGRNWDLLVGLSAAPVAWLAARGRLPNWGLLLWNIFGLGMLLNIVTISVLSMPTPLRAFPAEPANTFIATAPYIWLPVLLVPTALWGHLLVFRRLAAGLATPAAQRGIEV